MQALAVERLREDPTTPPDCTRGMADAGMLWPRAFCAFKGCSWSKMHGADSDLHCHLEEAHAEELEPFAQTMLRNSDKDRLLSVYSAAVAYHCRRQAELTRLSWAAARTCLTWASLSQLLSVGAFFQFFYVSFFCTRFWKQG